jgi:hypothetical protein
MKQEATPVDKGSKKPDKPQREAPGNGEAPAVRYASGEVFKKAHGKTGKLHAGLFRRLSE